MTLKQHMLDEYIKKNHENEFARILIPPMIRSIPAWQDISDDDEVGICHFFENWDRSLKIVKRLEKGLRHQRGVTG